MSLTVQVLHWLHSVCTCPRESLQDCAPEALKSCSIDHPTRLLQVAAQPFRTHTASQPDPPAGGLGVAGGVGAGMGTAGGGGAGVGVAVTGTGAGAGTGSGA
mmetsp:Transcript_37239/g.55561  ORF Transcript_37239/g.55561 Transcript_37239/m.55561 type:complete len:102 (+) Transcript_37239:3-308(+)